jgi:23S rRNA (adenine-N6)-dimethyltransferase
MSKSNFPYNITYSQNYIKSKKIASEVVDLANIKPTDHVIEIGPGRGALTEFIISKTTNFTAVEKDHALYEELKMKNEKVKNSFINQDFLNYTLPESGAYKIVGNIPFAITSDIIRKVFDAPNPPTSVSFILQKEAAERLLGIPLENLFSLRYKPWFETKIIKEFNSTDFEPVPSVDIVMISIEKLEEPKISLELKNSYLDFVTYCFERQKKDIAQALKKIFTKNQLDRISSETGLDLNLKAPEINSKMWVKLFESFTKHVDNEKKKIVSSSFNSLLAQQQNITKTHRTFPSKFSNSNRQGFQKNFFSRKNGAR